MFAANANVQFFRTPGRLLQCWVENSIKCVSGSTQHSLNLELADATAHTCTDSASYMLSRCFGFNTTNAKSSSAVLCQLFAAFKADAYG